MDWKVLEDKKESIITERKKLEILKNTIPKRERDLLQREKSYRSEIEINLKSKYKGLVDSFEIQKKKKLAEIKRVKESTEQVKEITEQELEDKRKQLLLDFEELKKKEFNRLYDVLVSKSESIIDELANDKANNILEKLGVKI